MTFPLDDEEIPDTPPHPGIAVHIEDPEIRRQLLEGTLIGTYLASDLVTSARRLADLSERHKGRFEEGMEVPESGRAAAAGAIAIACAALEASLNDFLLTADLLDSDLGPQPEARSIRLAIALSPEKRFDALAALAGELIDWGKEPYQSLALVLSVRKHLLHHEAGLVPVAKGLWPAKKLRDVALRIGSPYKIDDEIPLAWYVHVLNPRGARWAVTVIDSILDELDRFRRTIEDNAERRAKPSEPTGV